jgi:predicted Zn-ribbon and HTH transcriptional regulator
MNKEGWIVRLEATKGPTLMLNAWYLDKDGQQESSGWSAAALEKELQSENESLNEEVLDLVCPHCGHKFKELRRPKDTSRTVNAVCPQCEREFKELLKPYNRGRNETLECKACGWQSLSEASKPLICPDCGASQLVWINRRPPRLKEAALTEEPFYNYGTSTPALSAGTVDPLQNIPFPGESDPEGLKEYPVGAANTDAHTHQCWASPSGDGYTSTDRGHNHPVHAWEVVPGEDSHQHTLQNFDEPESTLDHGVDFTSFTRKDEL